MRNTFKLGFISDEDLYLHVKNTIQSYRFTVDLDEFNRNIIDPIALTFNSMVFSKSLREIIDNEVLRQNEKNSANLIGSFHQKIFDYIGNGWVVQQSGYDIVNEAERVFAEMKNKHNTMNSSSAEAVYTKMQNTIWQDKKARCYLVEVIARTSQDIIWELSIKGQHQKNERIRRISIDRFYKMVTGDACAFKKLCEALPMVIDDVLKEVDVTQASNKVFEELKKRDQDILRSLYLLAFKTYEGFNDLHFKR